MIVIKRGDDMEYIEIDGHKLHLFRAGDEKNPKLVFMSGSGTISPVYDYMAVPAAYLAWSRKQVNQRIRFMKRMRILNNYGMLFWYPLNERGLSENEIKHQRLLRRRNAMNPCYQNEAKALLKNAKLVHTAETIACPILMFVSDGKQVSAGWIEHEREFAEQTNARIIYLNCGHYIHYYESERISREIRAFVNCGGQ